MLLLHSLLATYWCLWSRHSSRLQTCTTCMRNASL